MTGTTVVIGAGADELVAAHLIARRGGRVVVLDPFPRDGVRPPERGWLPDEVARALGLAAGAVQYEVADPWLAAPLPQGGELSLWRDPVRTAEALGKVSSHDAGCWPEFCARMGDLARFLREVCLESPPDLLGGRAADLMQLGRLAVRFRRLKSAGMEELLRLAAMPVADFLDDWFESDILKGMLGAVSVAGLCHGPRSGGTALRLLHHQLGSPAGVFRAPFSDLRDVLARLPGIEVRAAVPVRIAIEAGAVTAVVLEQGEEIPASLVVSGAGPRRTLLELCDPAWFDPELVRAIGNIRSRGVVAHAELRLEGAPHRTPLVIAPSLDYLEHAYDDAKHGRISAAPALRVSRVRDHADGGSRVLVEVQYAPHRLREGEWSAALRTQLAQQAAGMLAAQTAGFAGAVADRLQAPPDLAAAYGWPDGQEEHAEPLLDQLLWMRPVPELARYRTPVRGLYLCGPAMHPGAGVAGASGYNAARELMHDLRRGHRAPRPAEHR